MKGNNGMKKMIIEVLNLFKVVDLLNIEFIILRNIDLYIEEGEFVFIMGVSGSGKSFLISILSGFDKNYIGNVKVCGENLLKLIDDEFVEYRNRKIGIVF